MNASSKKFSPPKAKPEADVAAFTKALDHPLKKEIEAVRKTILAAGDISEGIKWNAPSFRTADDFATMHLRSASDVQIIFHTGAKAKGKVMQGKVADPAGLLRWLAKDRAMASLGAGAALRANLPALTALTRAWAKAL